MSAHEETVRALVDLLYTSNTLQPEPDALGVYSNGYATWLADANDYTTTRPLSIEEIVERVEARLREVESRPLVAPG